MISHVASACIEAPASAVWDRLARLEDIQLWSEAVVAADCRPEAARGVGAERVCRLTGGVTIREHWIEWDEGRSFLYEGIGVPLLVKARNRWTVEPYGDRSLVVSEAEVWLKGRTVGRLAAPLLSWQIRRVATRTLAAFKYLVEHGEVPPVRHARLATPAAVC